MGSLNNINSNEKEAHHMETEVHTSLSWGYPLNGLVDLNSDLCSKSILSSRKGSWLKHLSHRETKYSMYQRNPYIFSSDFLRLRTTENEMDS
ncbi:hypothetical protein EUGRSUZ_L00977 [Eucalyptus grandis]|uniref:Uncharacterized protein n=1 Tax=Eucalyptus grandis TaxID=71139 RepID=A0A058ZU77_EUCGR|nr:hypothetical protein EUGRSUZ_L00977 [Eucalyptus grandis]